MVAALATATQSSAPPDRGALSHAHRRDVQLRYAARPAGRPYRPLYDRLPTLGEVTTALGLVTSRGGSQLAYDAPGIATQDGRTFYLTASPGTVGVVIRDENRRERARLREIDSQSIAADALKGWCDPLTGLRVDFLEQRVRGSITEWSRKSRARMVRRIAQLDLAAWNGDDPLGMITLTYPGDWLAVAPDGQSAKRHLRRFADAWRHTFGGSLRCVWKLEFQRRGAPHFHLLARLPAVTPSGEVFEVWLSRTWARIVAAQGDEFVRHLAAGTGVDYSARMTDPRRISIYFSKHGSKTRDDKEYQHIVPRAWRESGGAGRFWGYMGLQLADRSIEVDLGDALAARRVLRRVLKARTTRKVFTLGSSGQLTGGTVLVNDGPAFDSQLARYLVLRRRPIYDGRDVLPDRHPWP